MSATRNFFCEVNTIMSEKRPHVQSGEALNLVLLDPMSGTEPEIDFPDHDQDPGGELVLPRMLIIAQMYQLRKYSMKILRATQHGQFVQLEISFQKQHTWPTHTK